MAFRIDGGSYPALTKAPSIQGRTTIRLVSASAGQYSPANAGRLSFSAGTFSGYEGGVIAFSVTRNDGAQGTVAVDWAMTISEGAPTPAAGTISWNNGEAGAKTVQVQAGVVTADRVGTITLSNPRAVGGGSAPTIAGATAPFTTLNDLTVPSEPTLSAPTSINATGMTVGLAFASQDAQSGIQDHALERAIGDGSVAFTQIAQGASIFPAIITGLSGSTRYRYRARGRNRAGLYSIYSAIVEATTLAGSTSIYDAAPYNQPVTHVALGSQTGTGHTGSEADPFSPEDLMNFDPQGQPFHARLRGNFDATTISAFGRKYGYFGPRFSGTAQNPIIWSGAENPNTPGATDYPRFRRTADRGGILGVFSRDYFLCDKFAVTTWTGEPQGETYQVSAWGSRGTRYTRGYVNGESQGVVPIPSTNCGAFYFQNVFDCLVQDCVAENIGAPGSANRVWSGIEYYSADNFRAINNTIRNVQGIGIFEKGQVTDGTANRANRILRNRVHGIRRRGLFQYTHATGVSLEDATWWAQNIVYDCDEQCFWINPPVLPAGTSGVMVVNNLFAFAGFNALTWRYSSTYGFHPLLAFRNNLFLSSPRNIFFEFGSWAQQGGAAQFDHNLYFGHANHYEDNNGFLTYGAWRGLSGYQGHLNDGGGINADPLIMSAPSRDFRLQAGSPARNAGRDYLQLLGGATDAPINIGPYITADMSDAIGVRSNL